jgi:hypothetical protein
MFKRERALLVGMAFDAAGISSDSQFRLFCFKSAVRVMAIAALHRPLEDLVMEWLDELRPRFSVTTKAELRLAHP